jgi:hypothetical protein
MIERHWFTSSFSLWEAPWEAWPPLAAIARSSSLGRLAKLAGLESAIVEVRCSWSEVYSKCGCE